jgi:hypothetical protein
MAETYEYIAVKRFKYGERTIEIGQTWEPEGGVWDDKMIEAAMTKNPRRLINAVRVAAPQAVLEGGE